MNFELTQIPERTNKPRTSGMTMVTDKGLSLGEVEDLISVGYPYIDMVRIAFGTAMVTPKIEEKISLYQKHGIPVFFSGMLFEAFVVRNQYKEFLGLLKQFDMKFIEVSNGSPRISHEDKCRYIKELSGLGAVLSKIGSQDKDKLKVTPPYKWIELIEEELKAGAQYIVAEGKEDGTEGIYRDSGEVREGLINEILTKVPHERVIWETPNKDQQLFFLKLIGCNVNLGNISSGELIPLETMRIGLRGDSFQFYLDERLR